MATTLRRSFAIQRRVIGALVLREVITRYGRHNLGVLWMVVEPMLFTLGIVALWTAIDIGKAHALSLPVFALTGYTSVLLWRNCANRCNQAIKANHMLLHHRNVRIFDIYVARLLLEIGGVSASFLLLLTAFLMLGIGRVPYDVLSVCSALLLLAWFGIALSFIIGFFSEISELVDRIWHVFTYLFFPLSGAMFLCDWLPEAFRSVVLWFPMVHGTELIRYGFFGPIAKFHHDLTYFVAVNLVMSAIGMLMIRTLNRRIEP
jgi:capsular polysaccharide transport system permease protein